MEERLIEGLRIVEGKGIRVKCPFCKGERFYIPWPGTKITDLRGKKVQCFFCGKSYDVVPPPF